MPTQYLTGEKAVDDRVPTTDKLPPTVRSFVIAALLAERAPDVLKPPVPLRVATFVVPAYHLNADTLVGTLNQTVPGEGSIPIA